MLLFLLPLFHMPLCFCVPVHPVHSDLYLHWDVQHPAAVWCLCVSSLGQGTGRVHGRHLLSADPHLGHRGHQQGVWDTESRQYCPPHFPLSVITQAMLHGYRNCPKGTNKAVLNWTVTSFHSVVVVVFSAFSSWSNRFSCAPATLPVRAGSHSPSFPSSLRAPTGQTGDKTQISDFRSRQSLFSLLHLIISAHKSSVSDWEWMYNISAWYNPLWVKSSLIDELLEVIFWTAYKPKTKDLFKKNN